MSLLQGLFPGLQFCVFCSPWGWGFRQFKLETNKQKKSVKNLFWWTTSASATLPAGYSLHWQKCIRYLIWEWNKVNSHNSTLHKTVFLLSLSFFLFFLFFFSDIKQLGHVFSDIPSSFLRILKWTPHPYNCVDHSVGTCILLSHSLTRLAEPPADLAPNFDQREINTIKNHGARFELQCVGLGNEQ